MRGSLLVAVLSLVACRSRPPAEIVVVVDTDMTPGAEIDSVRVSVGVQGSFSRAIAADADLPATLTLSPGGSATASVEIVVEGLLGPEVVSREEVHTSFVPGPARELDVFLARRCRLVDRDRFCDALHVCTASSCESIERIGTDLPLFGAPGRLDGGPGLDAPCAQTPPACDAIDNDCDSRIDEDDEAPTTDAANCGRCGNACFTGLSCVQGFCGGRSQVVGGVSTSCVVTVGPGASTTCQGAHAADLESFGAVHELHANRGLRCVRDNADRVICVGSPFPLPGEPTATISGAAGATQIAVGNAHACAIKSGAIYCAGDDAQGQLDGMAGGPVTLDPPSPLRGPVSAVDVTAGDAFSCIVGSGGQTFCWGAADCGQLGRGTLPVGAIHAVQLGDGPSLAPLGGIVDVSCAGGGDATTDCRVMPPHCCAASQDGHVFCWGDNTYGQAQPERAPSREDAATLIGSSLPAIGAVEVSTGVSCAIAGDGHVWCWGDNRSGMLGLANRGAHGPVMLRIDPTIRQLALSVPARIPSMMPLSVHGLALAWDGRIFCWGDRMGDPCADGASVAPENIVIWDP